MTAKELSDFCEKRGVEIFVQHNTIADVLVVRMQKGGRVTSTEITRDAAASGGFGLTVRVILREMAEKLDKEGARL